MRVPDSLPGECAVALKEWAGVCEALARGRQTVLLRKGGIAEEQGRFVPEHSVFWLYPTHMHEAQQGLRDVLPIEVAPAATHLVPLRTLAVVESVVFVELPDVLPRLETFHAWTPETVLKRFHYRQPGLWVLGVCVYDRPDAESVPVTAAQLGCKSWVPLETPLSTAGLAPVLDEQEAARRRDRLAAALTTTG